MFLRLSKVIFHFPDMYSLANDLHFDFQILCFEDISDGMQQKPLIVATLLALNRVKRSEITYNKEKGKNVYNTDFIPK